MDAGEKSLFSLSEETRWNVLNLGAGVQSSCLALMATHGEITPIPDFAVFSDTQAEPQEVYDWLDFLRGEVAFPIYKETRGSLTKASLTPAIATAKAKHYRVGEKYMKRLIPLFGLLPDGSRTAALGRSCTEDYKIRVIEKKVKELCGIKRGQKDLAVTQWIGISWDELQRVKTSNREWSQLRYPLVEKRIRRSDCLEWMRANGYPEPPRSACVYCPFHSDEEWRRLRDRHPEEFQKAIQFDEDVRQLGETDSQLNMKVFLHRSCVPLKDVDFDSDEDRGQMSWDFMSECSGMCGV
jgi:hypothetical protein